MIIYKATNSINKKSYIGQTTRDIFTRMKRHLADTKKGSSTYFHNSIRKYGIDNFSWHVLCQCDTKEEMDEMEFHYIKQYNTFVYPDKSGYNMTLGGDGTQLFGDKNGMYGKNHSKSSIEKMSDNRKGLTAGDKNPSAVMSGSYLITFPDGHKEEIQNLRKWSRDNGLDNRHGRFYDMCNGRRNKPYNGYWCERLKHSHQRKVEMGVL